MPEIDSLRDLAAEFRPPPYDDLVAVSRGRRRRLAAVTSLSAAAAVVAVIVGVPSITGGTDTAPPTGPSPSPSLTRTTAPAAPMVNGRIQSLDEFLGRVGIACGDCYWPASGFDQHTGTLLLPDLEPDDGHGGRGLADIRVIGRDGPVARLACPDDIPCPVGDVPLSPGPGADQFSMLASHDQVRVLGFDGAVRRRIDLSSALDEDDNAYVGWLAWSPDGHRLAVQTGGAGHARIWLFDRDGGEPQLAYTASSTEDLPRLAITWVSWSPDGSRLGFVEEHWNLAAEFGRPKSERSESTQAVSLSVSNAEPGAPAAARTLYEYPEDHPQYNDDAPSVFLWSPDGARVAVRFYDQLLELSAEDGTVLAEDPFTSGLLIWPARQP